MSAISAFSRTSASRSIAWPARLRRERRFFPITKGSARRVTQGAIAWRLINILALNHTGLLHDAAGRDGGSFRDILSVFAPLSDNTADRQAQAVRSVSTRPVVRRLQQKSGTGVARGLEITITLDDKAFEGASAFLMGAVLDRFLAEYASINHFTQCVIATTERGTIMKWPPRIGAKGVI
ncbi:type VI secretion system baseplate subunit TssF [Roseibium salinum]|nr:type VI secretion system baseplate subunit TssF [Roseibium salinum]